MQCILTEKPSQAKNYAKALGGMTGTFNGKQYTIVNSVGHIFEFKQPELNVTDDLKEKYHSWEMSNLPWQLNDILWKKQLVSDKKAVYSKIKQAMEQANEIVIATDNDPTGEGTLLADEIILSLNLKNKNFYRSFHIDESEKEIQKAMNNLKDLGTDVTKDPDYQKALFRSKWDYLSMQWTRVFSNFAKTLLRQGRLKSYIVWLVGEQLKLIADYKKIPFYEARFKDENGIIYSDESSTKYNNPNDVIKIVGGMFASDIIKDSETTKYKAPDKLYNLNMLSGLLAPKGFGAKQVLDTYQKMYDDDVVSYPRTEDKKISPEQFNEFLSIANKIANVVGVDINLLTHIQPRSTHVGTGGSHGANRPSRNIPKSLNDIKEKYGDCGVAIYDLLARNSLAMLCEDYEYLQQKGHLKDYPSFKGIANIPIKNGYKAIFKDEEDDEQTNIKGLGKLAKPFVFEGFPKKPDYPTAKWLAKQLEKNDVGTGATRTSIYADITNPKTKNPLLSESKGKISMTTYGDMSYRLLENTHIGDVKLTEKVQQQMKDVANDFSKANEYLKEIEKLIVEDVEIVKNNSEHKVIQKAIETPNNKLPVGKCPMCGGIVYETKTKIGSAWKCENNTIKDSNCSFVLFENSKYFDNKIKLTTHKVSNLLNSGCCEKFKLKSKKGNQYEAYLKLKINGKFVNFEFVDYVNKK